MAKNTHSLKIQSKPDLPDLFPGEIYYRTHQQSVDSILLPLGINRQVESEGNSFFNEDTWYGLWFANDLASWAQKNPKVGTPTKQEISSLLFQGQQLSKRISSKRIVIARTPEMLDHRTACALIGGAYHEAWHTKYSRRTQLSVDDIVPLLEEWDTVPDWSGIAGMFQQLCHWIEDIRIERLGCIEYPGAQIPMCDLADFCINMEMDSRQKAAKQGLLNPQDPDYQRGLFLCCMRDLGLGYSTQATRDALKYYEKTVPHVVDLFRKGGPLRAALDEAKELRHDDMGFMRVAIKIAAVLYDLSQGNPPPQQQERGQGQQESGQGQGQDDKDAQSQGQGQEGPEDKSQGQGQESQGDGNQGQGQESQGDGNKSEGDSDKGQGQGDKSQDQDQDQGQGQGSGQGQADKDKDKDKDQGQGPDSQSSPHGSQRDQSNQNGSEEGESQAKGQSSEGGSKGGIGSSPDDFQNAASNILKGDEKKSQPMNHADALGEAFKDANEQHKGTYKKGEKPWNPKTTARDKALIVKKSNPELVQGLLSEVQQEVAALRARLRSIVRAQEMTDIEHGVRRGRRLSDRMLVDSRLSLMAGEVPSRAYQIESDSIDTSLAFCLCIDQSSSMSGILHEVRKGVLILMEPVENIGASTFAFGFRDGMSNGYGAGRGNHHRTDPITYDVFKGWNERFSAVKGRFAYTKAVGGTPMSDGVQYGLSAINMRNEGHRILAILTDGEPQANHIPVIKGQIRKAQESGIHVLGIGVTAHAKRVKTLFPDHVYAERLSDLPHKLIRKLNDICDFSGRDRGRRMHLKSPLPRVR